MVTIKPLGVYYILSIENVLNTYYITILYNCLLQLEIYSPELYLYSLIMTLDMTSTVISEIFP